MKISMEDRVQDLPDRLSVEAAVQDPCVLYKVPERDSPQKISVRDLKVRSLVKLTKQTAQRVVRGISKFPPHQKETDLTGPKF